MRISHRIEKRLRLKKRLAEHWTTMLYGQLAAYAIVLFVWLLPIPNPIKLLAVTFHELSHGIMGLLTGGRVFGIAVAPAGAGVTMGVGGNMFLILIAGYLGSSFWGAALYYASVKFRPRRALLALLLIVFGSAFLGWLSNDTLVFGLGSLFAMLPLFKFSGAVQVFFVRLVGSACCLYAPLEIVSELVRWGGRPPGVMGVETSSDVTQLASYLDFPAWAIAVVILLAQSLVLLFLVRWTCRNGAKAIVRHENAEKREALRLLADIRRQPGRIVIK